MKEKEQGKEQEELTGKEKPIRKKEKKKWKKSKIYRKFETEQQVEKQKTK